MRWRKRNPSSRPPDGRIHRTRRLRSRLPIVTMSALPVWAWTAGLLVLSNVCMQEVVTLTVFVPFAVLYMKPPVKLDFLWAGRCLLGAVYFGFRDACAGLRHRRDTYNFLLKGASMTGFKRKMARSRQSTKSIVKPVVDVI